MRVAIISKFITYQFETLRQNLKCNLIYLAQTLLGHIGVMVRLIQHLVFAIIIPVVFLNYSSIYHFLIQEYI